MDIKYFDTRRSYVLFRSKYVICRRIKTFGTLDGYIIIFWVKLKAKHILYRIIWLLLDSVWYVEVLQKS
jgi:hypothetical protein